MSCVPVRSARSRISIAPLGPYPIKGKDGAELVTTEVLDSPDEYWYSGHELVCCVVVVFFVFMLFATKQTSKQTTIILLRTSCTATTTSSRRSRRDACQKGCCQHEPNSGRRTADGFC